MRVSSAGLTLVAWTYIHGVTTSFRLSHLPANEGAPIRFSDPWVAGAPESCCPCLRFCAVFGGMIRALSIIMHHPLVATISGTSCTLSQNKIVWIRAGAIGPRGVPCRALHHGPTRTPSARPLPSPNRYNTPQARPISALPSCHPSTMLQRSIIRTTRTAVIGRRFASTDAPAGSKATKGVLARRVVTGVAAGFGVAVVRDWWTREQVSALEGHRS